MERSKPPRPTATSHGGARDSGITLDVGVTAWVDKTGTYTFTQTTDSKEPVFNASVAAFNGRPTIGDVADLDQFMTCSGFDLSGTAAIHVFMVCRTASGVAATKILLEHTASSATGNGWAISSNSSDELTVQNIGDVGRNAESLAGSDTSAVHILELDSNKGAAASEEANGYVDGVVTDTVILGPNDNTNSYSNDTLYLGNRSTESSSLRGRLEVAEILIYAEDIAAEIVTDARSYQATRYGITLP